jgi:hypothetical protein
VLGAYLAVDPRCLVPLFPSQPPNSKAISIQSQRRKTISPLHIISEEAPHKNKDPRKRNKPAKRTESPKKAKKNSGPLITSAIRCRKPN